MSLKSYLILCVVVAAVVSLAVLYVPGLGDEIEQRLLTFLATNAR